MLIDRFYLSTRDKSFAMVLAFKCRRLSSDIISFEASERIIVLFNVAFISSDN